MRIVELASWNDFAGAIADLRSEFGSHVVDIPDKGPISLDNDMLYRGQSDSEWNLQTTLERCTDDEYTVERYLLQVSSSVNEIESVTGKRWGLKPFPDIVDEIRNHDQDFMPVYLPHYEFLVYLRHHGFPSPLLDWTTSPFVAAYFAFEQRTKAEKCAVFVYVERPDGGKIGVGNCKIDTRGPYVTTHPRHFAQKAWYTTATRGNCGSKTHTFCSHHAVTPHFTGHRQDVLVKITMPQQDRCVALRQLEEYNINRYTLFQNEDALVQTMGLRAVDL